MIFISAREGRASAERAAQTASQEVELFRAISLAALKARARMLKLGTVVKIGGYELVVDEDEFGQWVTVQIIRPRREVEALGEANASELGVDLEVMGGIERREWLGCFMESLKDQLQRWQEIRCISGPGDNLTLEKKAYRKEMAWR